ncbi:hypothetical protein QBC46DRAFT_272696 [Diplogelasinospora grovesii]|uniref:Uncharacterized protein n=1 Tax=Diplogelasinospora grovesii TaxID=303347 RepID=A0AAN6MWX4_9PEZI|nr:hypothetical protein QBC46DRAFT_272696 [Diplogelasinospora grovesii]
MGHMSKFTFPLPGRKQKSAHPPTISGPLTKVQKILGTGEINIDSSTAPKDSNRPWEAKSSSGISITLSETSAGHTDGGESGLMTLGEDESLDSIAQRMGRWEDESEIIPRGLNRQSQTAMGSQGNDLITDASSLRRRQSSSTITSFYDKSKLPLSISQQTSSSAMAKGLPAKANALLDVDGAISGGKKKKPTRLDLSSFLSKAKSSKYINPETVKGQLLAPEVARSPSDMPSSPLTPPPIQQRVEPPRPLQQPSQGREAANPSDPTRHRPTKSTVNLHNLYDHYEQRTFQDMMEKEMYGGGFTDADLEPHVDRQISAYPTPPTSSSTNAYLSPVPVPPVPPVPIQAQHAAKQARMANAVDMPSITGTSPSSLMSPPADCNASISSRHTRTSKASKRTDRSLTDIDLQQNSVLSLSSDSEDDGYATSAKGSLAVPPLSDGQVSPTSPRSAMSQRSGAASTQDSRGKQQKRTSFAASPQFHTIPEGTATATAIPPKIAARASSLVPGPVAKKQSPGFSHQTSRYSVATTATCRTVSYDSRQSVDVDDTKAIAMVPAQSVPQRPKRPESLDEFPSPPGHRAPIPIARRTSTSEQPTPPLSPTSVDFYLQSQRNSTAGFDNGSIRSGQSLSSAAKAGRRSSNSSSLYDANSGRFMAVTRQEEMLLAALRMKRARMREDIIAEFEEEQDRDEYNHLQRLATDESMISGRSSASTTRTATNETGSLSARPQQRPQIRISTGSTDKQVENGCTTSARARSASALAGRSDLGASSRTSSKASKDRPRPSPSAMGGASGLEAQRKETATSRPSLQVTTGVSNKATRRGRQNTLDLQILDDAVEEADEAAAADIPRPDSPISPPFATEQMSMPKKKQVRLSAVGGSLKPNVEAGWWDDSG